MPIAWIETPGAIIRLHSERLEVSAPIASDERFSPPVNLPLSDIERLVVSEQAKLTFPALCEVLRRRIPVVVQDWRGQVLGSFLPADSPHAALRLRQYECVNEVEFGTSVTCKLVQAKIRNQRRLLNRLNSTRPRGIESVLDRMSALLKSTNCATDVAVLRGLEGSASALYWPAWAAFLPMEHPLVRRATRPPLNEVNAVLSYLSSVLYHECLAACHRRGLDPGLGYLHPSSNGRWSLPLDLMEPFRPAVLEATTLRLFTHRMLGMNDFHRRDGGVFLRSCAKKTVISQYEKRVQREFHSEHAGHQTTLRRQIEATVLGFRMALEEINNFRPFIMN